MSAATVTTARAGGIHPDARRALAVLGAAASPLARGVAVAIYLLFLAGGIVVWQVARVPEKGALAIVMLGAIGAGALWAIWFARVVAVQAAGRSLRMPQVDRDVAWALGWAFLVTVLAPAALASMAGADPRIAYGGMVAGALAGMLTLLLPGAVVGGSMAAAGWAMILGVALGVDWNVIDRLQANPQLWHWLPGLALVLAAGCALCWRAALADTRGSARSIWRSAALNFAAEASEPPGRRSGLEQMPDWMWPSGQIEPGGPARPVRAMGAWLGTPFAPLSRRQQSIQWAITALIVAGVAAYVVRGPGLVPFTGVMAGAALVGGILGALVPQGARLDTLRRQTAGEWSELALLPGWGDAASQRSLLLRAVARPVGQVTIGLLVAVLAIALWNRADLVGTAMAVLAVLGIGAVGLVACLRPLAGQRPELGWMSGLCLLGVALPAVTLFAALSELRALLGSVAWSALGAGWILATAFLLATGHRAWRGFLAQPHPFVEVRPDARTSGWARLRREISPTRLVIGIGFLIGIGFGVGLALGWF